MRTSPSAWPTPSTPRMAVAGCSSSPEAAVRRRAWGLRADRHEGVDLLAESGVAGVQ